MPTYQYACTACGEQHEAVQAFTDPPLTECPACHGRLRKVFSAVGVVFKGSGFYKTDSRSAAKTGSGKDGSSSGGGKDGGSESSTPIKAGSSSGTSGTTKTDSGSSSGSTSTPVAKTA